MSPRSFLVSRQTHAQQPIGTSSSSPPSSTLPLRRKDDRQARSFVGSNNNRNSLATPTTDKMGAKRREPTESPSPSPSPPKTTTTLTRPTTPTEPLQIPTKTNRGTAHPSKHHSDHHHQRRRQHSSQRAKDGHSPDAIPPSVAALLAVTSIPPLKSQRTLRQRMVREKRMTVDAIIERAQESEKELSLNLSKSPLDLLLSAPEDLEDDISISDSTLGSALSTRTVSMESMPSLADSFGTETFPSVDTPYSPPRGRKARPTRRSLEPVSSPPGQSQEHPLSAAEIDLEELDFRVFGGNPPDQEEKEIEARMPFLPFKSVFKSNLTASLRALRNAARSFSSMNLTSIPPEDFLTRSILAIDPQVPFTDERRPPPLQEEPTAALRRYLNPTQSSRLEPAASTAAPVIPTRSFTASIQMQTYKVQRSKSAPPSSRMRYSSAGDPSGRNTARKEAALSFPMPGPRQREMRENSDFIRIAVMEMAMRKKGKLDDQRPGRARWALPARKVPSKPYEVGVDGVPIRWIAVTY